MAVIAEALALAVPVDRNLWKTGAMKSLVPALILVLAISACGSRPTLEPRAAGNPLRVDLSGQWILRSGDELAVSHEQTIRLPARSTRREIETRRVAPEGRSRELSAYLFLESGTQLKVTQTDYGLFFSFDRAVVEEYNFGENRVVSIGPIRAQRVSGWEGPTFVVETLDEDGHVLTERWTLDEGTLIRDISIAKGDEVSFRKRQVFDPQ